MMKKIKPLIKILEKIIKFLIIDIFVIIDNIFDFKISKSTFDWCTKVLGLTRKNFHNLTENFFSIGLAYFIISILYITWKIIKYIVKLTELVNSKEEKNKEEKNKEEKNIIPTI